jgi:HTH-type transcriptional regulator/antitoxin HipB
VGFKQTTVSDFELKPESTKLETLFKILAALDLELYVSERETELTDVSNKKREW